MKIESLIDRINKLEEKIVILELENSRLRSENKTLQDKLNINSKNSSIPSSKELYKMTRKKKPSGNKQGAQVGHKGSTQQEYKANEIIKIDLDSDICDCGGHIKLIDPRIHKKVDIEEIKPHVVEYQLARGQCNVCKKKVRKTLPESIGEDLLGPRIKSSIACLTGYYKNSKRDTVKILRDLFNIKISLGTVSNTEGRISNKCIDSYEEIECALTYEKVVHIDETSSYNKGKLGWCWTFCSKNYSLFKIEKTRSKKVLEGSVFGPDDNIIITDRYAVYNYFRRENRQICWAHLSRDFERFANSRFENVSEIGNYLTRCAREVFAIRNGLLLNQIDQMFFRRKSRKIRKEMNIYLKKIINNSGSVHASRVAENLLKCDDIMWKFLEDPENIPITNNHAEQQIRSFVIYRKNSYFTQSERGDRFVERLKSLYLTWIKQKQNPFQNLLAITSS
jgi:transposase